MLLPLLFSAAAAYPGAPHLSRDLSKSSHYASSERDPLTPDLQVWPLPQSATFPASRGAACLSPIFSMSCTGACPDPLPEAFDRYAGYMTFAGAPSPTASANWISGLAITVSASAPLALRVSENYTLSLPSGVGNDTIAMLTADTQWGALRGIETFSQLFVWAGRGVPVSYCTSSAGLQVVDFPKYPWRGLLIDSSRHFLPLSAILVTLDAMAFNKLNTLHCECADQPPAFFARANPPLHKLQGT